MTIYIKIYFVYFLNILIKIIGQLRNCLANNMIIEVSLFNACLRFLKKYLRIMLFTLKNGVSPRGQTPLRIDRYLIG